MKYIRVALLEIRVNVQKTIEIPLIIHFINIEVQIIAYGELAKKHRNIEKFSRGN